MLCYNDMKKETAFRVCDRKGCQCMACYECLDSWYEPYGKLSVKHTTLSVTGKFRWGSSFGWAQKLATSIFSSDISPL